MNIVEAVGRAVKEGKCITLPPFRDTAKIKPTNEKGNCILMRADGSHQSKGGWQPTADDLLATDWIVVD